MRITSVPVPGWVTDAKLSFEAAFGRLRHAIAVCVQFTGTRLLHGFAGDQPIHDQCNETCRRHGVEDWKDPSEPWVSRWLTFQLAERHKLAHLRLRSHSLDLCQALLQFTFQPQARENPTNEIKS